MNAMIETLNALAARLVGFAGPMLWQSSLLIGLLLILDVALRRKLRPGVRYGLWLVVLVKLVLPPSLALPSGLGWWLRPGVPAPLPPPAPMVVRYGADLGAGVPAIPALASPPPAAGMAPAAWLLLAGAGVSLALLVWMLARWRRVARDTRQAVPAPEWLTALLEETRQSAGLRRPVGLRVVERNISPALCGLFRPVLLVPRSLVEQLAPQQMRAILLHELLHLRRGDVWVNCLQALLQVLYWWHPLLWVANARIRQVREEAVDDAVMVALAHEAEAYAPTLLHVARLALARPLTSLGLVGILESQGALRQRIQRLVELRPPRHAGLTAASALCVAAFGAMALPMGQAPAPETGAVTKAEVKPAATAQSTPAVTALIQEAKGLFGQGQWDAAEAKLKQAETLAKEPKPQAIAFYQALIRQQRAQLARQEAAATNRSASNQGPAAVSGRRAILTKLNTIRFDRVQFDSMRLDAVIRYLSEEARKRDPAQQGINFMLSPNLVPAPQGNNGPLELDPLPIQLDPPLTNLRLVDVLDAIVKLAPAPIKYSIEDYAVVITWRGNEAPPLYQRAYRVDPNTFQQGIEGASGTKFPPGANASEMLPVLRTFFQGLGVDLQPPKSLFYNDRRGALLVRATIEDLDRIEAAVQVLNTSPTQVMLETRFYAIPEALAQSGTNGAAGLQLDFTRLEHGSAVVPPAQAARIQKALQAGASVEVLSQGAVTTLSGRQAQLETVNRQMIATKLNPAALNPPGVTNVPDVTGALLTEEVSLGPVVDVIAVVSPDAANVQLTAMASLSEFFGYDEPTNTVTVYVNGKTQSVAVPRPHFGHWQVSASAIVRDGHTLLLASPLAGRVPATGTTAPAKRWLVAMVTPTAIDPTGNRLNRDPEAASK